MMSGDSTVKVNLEMSPADFIKFKYSQVTSDLEPSLCAQRQCKNIHFPARKRNVP